MPQQSELILLVIALLSLFVVKYLAANSKTALPRSLYMGFLCITGSNIAAFLEDTAYAGPLNFLEHLLFLAAGVCFVLAARRFQLARPQEGEDAP